MSIIELGKASAPVQGVKGNAESTYRTGNVNLTPANIGALALAGGKMTGTLSFNDSNALPQRSSGTVFPLTINAFADGGTVGWSDVSTFRSLIGASSTSHTHNYAGSSSAGGSATSSVKWDGFTKSTSSSWGIQTGALITRFDDDAGGSMIWRKNCPVNGQMSLVIDGYVYVAEGQKRVKINPDVLTTTETTGTVSLSSSAANYNHMRIYYKVTDANKQYSSVDVSSPNGKVVSLILASPNFEGVWINGAQVTISGTQITRKSNHNAHAGTAGNHSATQVIAIDRVEAWNE